MGDLISACITSGVKLARRQHGLLYGTREVAIDPMSLKTTDMGGYHEIAAADYVVVVMRLLKCNGAKSIACWFYNFQTTSNGMIEDLKTISQPRKIGISIM